MSPGASRVTGGRHPAARKALLALLLTPLLSTGCPERRAATADGSAPAASGPVAPPGPSATQRDEARERAARAVITDSCLGCHDVQLLQQQRLTRAQWSAVIDKMQRWGAPLEPAQKEAVLALTGSRYRLGRPPHKPPRLSLKNAEEAVAARFDRPGSPLDSGDATVGATFYAQACASCHGPTGGGTALGLVLIDRPVLYQTLTFAQVVRSGRGRMPALPATDAQIGGLLAHLRDLTDRLAAAPPGL